MVLGYPVVVAFRWAWRSASFLALACGGDSTAQPSTGDDAATTDAASTSVASTGDTGGAETGTASATDSSDAAETVGPPIVFDVADISDMGMPSGDDIVCSSDLKY